MRLHKKGAFDTINNMMIGFVGFVLLVVITILMLSTLKQTSVVCEGNYYQGVCYSCNGTWPYFNTTTPTNITCFNATSGADLDGITAPEDTSMAYNSTKDLQSAALLPPQFASLIVIVVIIVGILSLLAILGYSAYKRMKG